MTRRVVALLGILAIVGLATALIWRVYLHHSQIRDVEEVPAVVEFVDSDNLARALLQITVETQIKCDGPPLFSPQCV